MAEPDRPLATQNLIGGLQSIWPVAEPAWPEPTYPNERARGRARSFSFVRSVVVVVADLAKLTTNVVLVDERPNGRAARRTTMRKLRRVRVRHEWRRVCAYRTRRLCTNDCACVLNCRVDRIGCDANVKHGSPFVCDCDERKICSHFARESFANASRQTREGRSARLPRSFAPCRRAFAHRALRLLGRAAPRDKVFARRVRLIGRYDPGRTLRVTRTRKRSAQERTNELTVYAKLACESFGANGRFVRLDHNPIVARSFVRVNIFDCPNIERSEHVRSNASVAERDNVVGADNMRGDVVERDNAPPPLPPPKGDLTNGRGSCRSEASRPRDFRPQQSYAWGLA